MKKMIAVGIGDRDGATVVAVKTTKTGNTSNGESVNVEARNKMEKSFRAEIEVMKKLRAPNLVAMLGACLECRPFLMILEYVVAMPYICTGFGLW